jgi:hypothetical protein
MLVSIPQPLKTVSINVGGNIHAIRVAPTAVILPACTDENPDDLLRRVALSAFGPPAEQWKER